MRVESNGCFGNYYFQWGYFGDFGFPLSFTIFHPPDMVPSEIAGKLEKVKPIREGALMLCDTMPNPID
jgi:hypothetical protein